MADYTASGNLRKNHSKQWKHDQHFSEASLAEDFLKKDWIENCVNNTKSGKVKYFYCRSGGKQCPTAAKLHYVSSVHLWISTREHVHSDAVEHGLTFKQKAEIELLMERVSQNLTNFYK